MNIRSFFFIAFVTTVIISLTGCVRKKDLLLQLSRDMTKNEVELKMGTPDEIRCPIVTVKGDVIDIWEYRLATLDEEQWSKNFVVTLGCCLLFPPLAFIPAVCMPSALSYDIYFLKFINNFLSQWGRRSDVELPLNHQGSI